MSQSTLNPPKAVPKRAEVIADDDTMKEAIQRLDTRTFGLFHKTTLRFAIQEGQEENLADLTKRMLDKNGIEEEETEAQGIMKFNPFEEALQFTLEAGTYLYYGIKWKRNRFSIVPQFISYGCCPTCYRAFPRGDQCTRCNETAKDLYFLGGFPQVPEYHDRSTGPPDELFQHCPDYHEGIAEPLDLSVSAGHKNVIVPFDLEYFVPNNSSYDEDNLGLWEIKGVSDFLHYMHNNGLLDRLGPGIEAYIARATGAHDDDVHHDILMYKDLFTAEQKHQLRMERREKQLHLLDRSANQMYNEFEHIDY